jgi:hypothetical protein
MSLITPSSSDDGHQDTILRDTFTPNDSEEGDVASQRYQDETIFAEDPFAQGVVEPYVAPIHRGKSQPVFSF